MRLKTCEFTLILKNNIRRRNLKHFLTPSIHLCTSTYHLCKIDNDII